MPVHIQYEAPPECPNIDEFLRFVQRRSRSIRAARPNEVGPLLRVRLQQGPDGAVGELSLDGSDDRQARFVRAHSCVDVAETLAFTTALGLDPYADEPPATPVMDAPPSQPPPRPAPSAPRPTAWRVSGSMSALQANLIDTRLAWGGKLGVGVELDRPDAFRPSVHVNVVYARDDVFGEPQTLTIRWMAAQVWLCPLRAELDTSFSFGFCAQFDVGRLEATALALDDARSAKRNWFAAGGVMRLGVRLRGSLSLEAALGATAPLVKRRFTAYEPAREIGGTPALTLTTALGLVHTF